MLATARRHCPNEALFWQEHAIAIGALNVSKSTILNWIESDKIPYVKLPGGDYRVPLAGLLTSLSGTYQLDEEIRTLDERYAAGSDADVQAVLEGDD